MKITDIITEELSDREKIQQLQQRNPALAARMMPWIEQGKDFDVAAEYVRMDMDKNRSRQDARGRNLKHDRYYVSNKNSSGSLARQAATSVSQAASQLSKNDSMNPRDVSRALRTSMASGSAALKNYGINKLKKVAGDLRGSSAAENSENDK